MFEVKSLDMTVRYFPSIFLLLFTFQSIAQDQAAYWPKQVEVDGLVITIYAPEPEAFENNLLDARSAFSLFDKILLKQIIEAYAHDSKG